MVTTVLLGLTLAMAKPDVKRTVSESWTRTLVVGHRGAAAYEPENTLRSFERAISDGAVATECDVHMSKDGEPVIMHDYTLDRTTKIKGQVKETPWAVMNEAGVPHLADFTRTTKDRIISVIEIKGGEGVAKAVVDHVVKEKMLDQTIIFSFNDKIVEEVKTLNPNVFTVWLIAAKQTPEAFATTKATFERTRANALGVGYTNCSPEFVSAVHGLKVPLFVWTVPPGPQVDRLKGLKVNFIITDHPGDVKKQLSAN